MRYVKILGFFLLLLHSLGCQTNNPTVPGGGVPTYTAVFQNLVTPNTAYNGVSNTCVKADDPDTSNGGEILLVIASGPSTLDWKRSLLRFDLSTLPLNAHIVGAYVQLAFQENYIPSGSRVIGVHRMKCTWTEAATWNEDGQGSPWGACKTSPDSSPMVRGESFTAMPMDTVAFTPSTAYNEVYAWNLDPSVVQGWLDDPSVNFGMVFASEGEGTEPTGWISLGGRSYYNGGPWGPALFVTYSIP